MKFSIVYSIILIKIFIVMSACKSPVPNVKNDELIFHSINEIIHERFEIEDESDGYINGDSIKDIIYVIKKINGGKRSLIVSVGTEKDEYKMFASNDKAIENMERTLDSIDTFISVKIQKGKITIHHIDSKNVHCDIVHEFVYSDKEDAIYLDKIIKTSCKGETNFLEKEIVRTSRDFGRVNFKDFNIKKDY